MSNVKKLFSLLTEMGVLKDCKSVGSNRHEGMWEVWGHFQNENGRKNGRIAQFENVEDAVDFEVMFQQSQK